MIRWLIIVLVAMSFRRGLSEDEMNGALVQAFRWRDAAWRADVIYAARQRNRAKLMRRVDA